MSPRLLLDEGRGALQSGLDEKQRGRLGRATIIIGVAINIVIVIIIGAASGFLQASSDIFASPPGAPAVLSCLSYVGSRAL